MKTKAMILTAALILAATMNTNAQSILDSISFETPTKVARPTGSLVWLKEYPRNNSPKYKREPGGEDVWVTKHRLYAASSAPAGWIGIDGGYCTTRQAHMSTGNTLTDDMFNRFCGWCEGYDDGNEWIVGKTRSERDLVVCYEKSGFSTLWLGKQEGNLLVFKYRIFCNIEIDENNSNPNYFKNLPEERDGMTIWNITIGPNLVQEVTWGGMGTTKTLNFSKLNDRVLEVLFRKAIEEWNWRDDYFYLNSELLSGEYANYVFG